MELMMVVGEWEGGGKVEALVYVMHFVMSTIVQ